MNDPRVVNASDDVVRVGVTGHIYLTEASRQPIFEELVRVLRSFSTVHGVTCLAEGTDRLFAQAVRACAGTFEVVLPGVSSPGAEVAGLLDEASSVSQLPCGRRRAACYAAASAEMLRRSDVLVAVWDGDPHGGRGGTADTVARARAIGLPVTVVWPAGATRVSGPN